MEHAAASHAAACRIVKGRVAAFLLLLGHTVQLSVQCPLSCCNSRRWSSCTSHPSPQATAAPPPLEMLDQRFPPWNGCDRAAPPTEMMQQQILHQEQLHWLTLPSS